MTVSRVGLSVVAAIMVALVAWVHARGELKRRWSGRRSESLRIGAFRAGSVVLVFSLVWPLEGWAQKLFFVHQIGIMAARIVVPMLIAVSHPAGRLVAGLPRSIRRPFLKRLLLWRPGRAAWSIVTRPAATLTLYIGALYAWEWPAAQQAALSQPFVDAAMHLSLLLTGLLFWGRIFERRPTPHGASHGVRLMMLWIAILTQILLGAFVTVKTTLLYPAYGTGLHMGFMPALADEETGGFLIWIPSGFLSLLALIGVIHMWGLHETRMDERRRRWSSSNSAILLYPETARALRAMTRDRNRRLAAGLIGFVLVVFGAMFGFVGGAHRIHRRENMRLYMLSRR